MEKTRQTKQAPYGCRQGAASTVSSSPNIGLKKNIVQQAVLSKIFYPETRRNTYKNISQAIDRQAEHLVKNSVYGRIQQRQTEDKKKEK